MRRFAILLLISSLGLALQPLAGSGRQPGLGEAPAEPFTRQAWSSNQDLYEAILSHPFLRELLDGTLDRDRFAFYVVQDTHYLVAFARALRAAADKAPRDEWARLLRTHADESLEEERRLHADLIASYGLTPEEVRTFEPAPEAFAYMSYLVSTAHSESFEAAMAALLPCYWIYWEVGKALQAAGSPDATYQQWIDAYASEAYGRTVSSVLAIVDEVAAAAGPSRRADMLAHFRRSVRYEWMFWDSAYHRRRWPPE